MAKTTRIRQEPKLGDFLAAHTDVESGSPKALKSSPNHLYYSEAPFFTFSGRISLSRYWMLNLIFGFFIPLISIALYYYYSKMLQPFNTLFVIVFSLYTTYWLTSLCARRLRDLNLSALWLLILLAPLVNIVVLAYLGLMPGTAEANRFGSVNHPLSKVKIAFMLIGWIGSIAATYVITNHFLESGTLKF